MTGYGEPSWHPHASVETLKARAELNRSVRAFFSAREVLEVETPILSAHATVDRHIESFAVTYPESRTSNPGLWLHTSPEFAMKRLLAAGSGPIYQIAKVFRREEQGRHHNPEFSLLEWYRPGWNHLQLMDEVEALVRALGVASEEPFERLSYRAAFLLHAGLDPVRSDFMRLRDGLAEFEISLPMGITREEMENRDFWLNLWMSQVVGPRLGQSAPCFLYDFPASQAALARVRPGLTEHDAPVAERFELFWKGIELANGFHELTDAAEQEARFQRDQAAREQAGLRVPPYDAHLIAALQAGLPACAGVALGLDRLLMLKLGLNELASTLSFAGDRA